MAKKCPRGFICTDWSMVAIVAVVVVAAIAAIWFWAKRPLIEETRSSAAAASAEPQVIVVQAPPAPGLAFGMSTRVKPDLYPEPVRRLAAPIPALAARGPVTGPYQQVGVLVAEGGSSTSAAPDRTVLPLYGRELDSRRGKWNYYTRTDGANPVQVPVRVRNRVCDDDRVGCDEVYNDDSVHVPALGRSMKASIYKTSIFG
jgi:hypothetical protein